MNDRDMRLAALLLLAFFVWGGIAWYWYACGIKDLCDTKDTLFIPFTSEK